MGNYGQDITNNIMSKLSNNIKSSFEQNMELSQEALKCKTATDFIEFQRKHFEINYKNMIKLYNDLFYDIRNLTSKNLNVILKKHNQ